jgi:hypothetical protein
MAIKPILFNTEMVRANLDGRKSCTRRIVKPQPQGRLCYTFAGCDCGTWGYPSKTAYENWGDEYKLPEDITDEELKKRWKPPYHTDDILYVRETWCKGLERYIYRADYSDTEKFYRNGKEIEMKWKPSIRMPKEAARIWLKVTDVRVERLQEITEAGAEAEGAVNNIGMIHAPDNEYDHIHTAKEHFIEIWNSTIKKSDIDRYGWDANPYVWVIEFERCEKPEGV